MGVKSTIHLTRAEAERRWVDRVLELHREVVEHGASRLSNERLENDLERMNDDAHNGEGFENYLIDGEG